MINVSNKFIFTKTHCFTKKSIKVQIDTKDKSNESHKTTQ
jgi:uncharacterized protein YabE (DUF348 family)